MGPGRKSCHESWVRSVSDFSGVDHVDDVDYGLRHTLPAPGDAPRGAKAGPVEHTDEKALKVLEEVGRGQRAEGSVVRGATQHRAT